jgi:hypothetical protein
MSTNATSLLPRPWAGVLGSAAAERSVAGGWRGRLGVALLAVMVAVSLFIVIAAADRPTFLIPPSAQHYFPHWLAGPLGGLWPQFARSTRLLNYLFTYGVVTMYGVYLLILWLVPHVRARWAIAAVVAIHVVLFLSPPLALTDIFNYLNYGRMEIVHGLNPYATIPILEPHDDPAFAMSNWHHLLSPYGPMFTLITFALVPLGVAASFWAVKAILMVFSLGTLVLVWRCARLLGRDPVRSVVFVGLNPVVLMWGLGGDHNDFITVFFLMLAIYLLLRSRARAIAAGEPGARSDLGAHEREVATPAHPAPAADVVRRPAVAPVAPVAAVAPAVGSALGFSSVAALARVARRSPTAWLARAWRAAAMRSLGLRVRALPASAVSAGAPPADAPVGPSGGSPGVPAAPPVGSDGVVDPQRGSSGLRADSGFEDDALGAPRRRGRLALSELCAGAALVFAVSMKASAAVLIPVLLLGLAWSRRRAGYLLLGMVASAIAAGAATYVAFGAHIPDLSTQDKLITAESLPNLLGLLLGQGGETDVLRRIVQGALVASVLWAGWWAWRRREMITPAAWATVALLATLSWVLPWYVLWLLPLATLAGSRALQRVALAFGVYLILVWAPLAGAWYAAIGFAPTKTALGQAHQRETKFLLH